MINTSKRRGKFLITGFATLILLGLLTVGAFAASNLGEQKHDMGAMTQGFQSGHDMSSMTNDSQSGHDMNNMVHSGHDKKETAKDDNPWPILYGFGGFIFVVIISAGIMKFTGRKGRGVN
ncbi:hypothetical protein Ga0466249_002850 [Sporomusaceae bacterium BoRhaA]|uniref:hypothetical protein n=1 Tax=Pelorhabdus rhamnosifermentans TaxID=2772457 RepID=UPI001C0608F3|nr:hypothetical protein [Pelorhabdus rhamnosifermentans]MBU2701731.1 hypothetical protein [Pelorhabdus rhamnosifermentans]